MKKRTAFGILCTVILTITAAILLPTVYTSKAPSSSSSAAASYHIEEKRLPLTVTDQGQGADHAAAYVLRYLGEKKSPEELAPRFKNVFGFISPSCVAKLFKTQGYDARAHHGDLSTLKELVSEGAPVIVLLRGSHGTQYAVVTGYDEDMIYLYDPLTDSAEHNGKACNRTVGTEKFEKLWKTPTLIADNAYIVIKEKR